MRSRAVQRALCGGEFSPSDFCFKVAPHDVALAALKPDIELAFGWSIFNERGVIAINGVIIIWIKPLEDMARVLFVPACEQILDVALARVCGRCQKILALDLSL